MDMDQKRITKVERPVNLPKLETRKLDKDENIEPSDREENTADKLTSRPWRIGLHLLDSDSQLIIDLRHAVALGRSYPETEIYDGVDLAPFDAYKRGVSRNHASLHIHDGKLMIMDNESANGTLLAEKELQPGKLYPVRHGDEVQLGTMRIKFSIIHNTFA